MRTAITSRSVSIVATSLTPSTKRFQFLNTCRDSRSLTTYAERVDRVFTRTTVFPENGAVREVLDSSRRIIIEADASETRGPSRAHKSRQPQGSTRLQTADAVVERILHRCLVEMRRQARQLRAGSVEPLAPVPFIQLLQQRLV